MKLKETLSLRKVADEYIAIMTVDGVVDYTRAIALNETAAYLIEQTELREFSPEEWAKLLVDKYDVTVEQARSDVDALIQSLREIGILA